ncbi:MAG: hypothetical protein AAFN79_06250 [Pseudomonadota bacterium]
MNDRNDNHDFRIVFRFNQVDDLGIAFANPSEALTVATACKRHLSDELAFVADRLRPSDRSAWV